MVDIGLILFIGTVASIGVLIIAPLPLIYTAAFVAFTPILGIVLWYVSGALFRALGVRGNPLSDAVVECLDEEAPGLFAKETDETLLHETLSPAEPVGSEQRDVGRKGGKKRAEGMTPERRGDC